MACRARDVTVSAAARFGHGCGHPLTATPTATPQRAARSPEPFRERRHLPVLFGDLVRSQRDACAEVVRHHGGRVAQFHGDGLVVNFGYPVAREGDARRAVQADLDVVQAVRPPATPTPAPASAA